MMRGAKDEEKLMSPMFPRLHVNDTEKGGPRAPPRNKMALYEQLSIPSQRFGSGSASMLPLPHNSGSGLVPSLSSSQSGGYERNAFIPFCNSPATSRLAEKSVSYSSGGAKLNSAMASQENKSINAKNDQSLKTALPLSSSAKCNSFQSNNFSNFKNFSGKKIEDENDFRVPRSAQSGAAVNRSLTQHSKNRENQPHLSLSFSTQFQDCSEKPKKGTGTMDLKARSQIEKVKVDQTCQDSMERSSSVPSVNDKTSVEASSSPLGKDNNTELLMRAHATSNHGCRSGSVDVQQSLYCTNAPLNQGFGTRQDQTVPRDDHLLESDGVKDKENPSKVGGDSHPWSSLGDDKRSPNGLQNGSTCHNDKKCRSSQVGNIKKRNDVSETSMVDSISALNITPDDVVGAIGEQQFWKARRAIVNQQRVFAVQVFELHRLIKVQQLFAGSPHLLLEDNLYVGKTSIKPSTVKKVPSEYAEEQPPLAVESKGHSQKAHPSTEFADENAVGKLPLPSVNNETKLAPPRSNYASYSANATLAPVAVNNKPSPWCFPLPGNQWLVPVMSPSEGLVYKPYAGSCPPSAGFMAAVNGNCTPMNLTPGDGNFFNAAYGIPASHHQGIGILPPTPSCGQNYFPPYVVPVMNPTISGSAVEQISPLTGNRSKDNELSVGDVNLVISNHSSCNLSSQLSRAISRCGGKFQVSKESEVQGSTASSPFERSKGDALPLFPTEPTVQPSDQNAQTKEHRAHVIKVVPYNPRSATESAARIFQYMITSCLFCGFIFCISARSAVL